MFDLLCSVRVVTTQMRGRGMQLVLALATGADCEIGTLDRLILCTALCWSAHPMRTLHGHDAGKRTLRPTTSRPCCFIAGTSCSTIR